MEQPVPSKESGSTLSPKVLPAPSEIPPSVMAISNLRCPSPPPILTNSRSATVAPTQSIPHGSGIPFTRGESEIATGIATLAERVDGTKNTGPISFPSINASASSINTAQNPPQVNHQKQPSVHAHFSVDESLKPNRSRSGSRTSEQSSIIKPSISESSERLSQLSIKSEIPTKEEKSNIDPRLPQDDGKVHILLGVCGALSTIKVKLIINKLIEIYTPDKISIQLILTKASENFISQEALNHLETVKKVRIWRDNDEWTTWKSRLDPVLHIELRRWADIFIVSPLTANTLSKIALGICDNLLTNVIRAWNTSYPILLAPAMVSYSYNAITTKRQIRLIAEEMPWIEILKPVEKVVGSYGDIGMGGMMDWNEIVNKIVLKLGRYPEIEDEIDDEETEKKDEAAVEVDDEDDEVDDDEDEDDEDEDDEDDEDDNDDDDEDDEVDEVENNV